MLRLILIVIIIVFVLYCFGKADSDDSSHQQSPRVDGSSMGSASFATAQTSSQKKTRTRQESAADVAWSASQQSTMHANVTESANAEGETGGQSDFADPHSAHNDQSFGLMAERTSHDCEDASLPGDAGQWRAADIPRREVGAKETDSMSTAERFAAIGRVYSQIQQRQDAGDMTAHASSDEQDSAVLQQEDVLLDMSEIRKGDDRSQ